MLLLRTVGQAKCVALRLEGLRIWAFPDLKKQQNGSCRRPVWHRQKNEPLLSLQKGRNSPKQFANKPVNPALLVLALPADPLPLLTYRPCKMQVQ
jgi:hypothetical protein